MAGAGLVHGGDRAAAARQGQVLRRGHRRDPGSKHITQRLEAYRAKLAARPDLYEHVEVVNFPLDGSDVVPPGILDMVVTFRNIHNWMADDQAAQAFATIYRALKPGGVLGWSSTAAIPP